MNQPSNSAPTLNPAGQGTSYPPQPSVTPPSPPKRKSTLRWSLPILYLLILIAVGGWFWFKYYYRPVATPLVISNTSPKPSPSLTLSPSPVSPTTGWQTYTNQQYGFTFQYPTDFTVKEVTSQAGLTVTIDPTGKNFTVNSQSVDLLSLSWNQVQDGTTFNNFVQSIQAEGKTNIQIGQGNAFSAMKLVNINNSQIDEVVFQAGNIISSFYSRVTLIGGLNLISSDQTSAYNTDFNLILGTFNYTG
ncbi:MAG: hypothetical protein ABSE91_02595 [Patescibacteria group bacterium]